MKYLIIEDERLAAERLEKMIHALRPSWNLIGVAASVVEGIRLFQTNKDADLVFMDIHLGDGDSFSIFDNVEVNQPVIFTTAFEEYSIKAFKVNSIEYLLKPIALEDLQFAIEKFEKLGQLKSNINRKLNEAFPERRKRFLISVGNKLKIKEMDEILYFYSEQKNTFLMDAQGFHYPLEKSLDKLQEDVDPQSFFRINRKYLISIKAIDVMNLTGPARLKLELPFSKDDDVYVARERYAEFKDWLDK